MSDQRASLSLRFDTSIYRLVAIKKAAYKFAGRCHVRVGATEGGVVTVELMAKGLIDDLRYIAGDFENEVLDQELRETIATETEGVRNLLLAQAFSQTSLLDPVGESADYHDDPLELRRSDHQRAGRPLDGKSFGQ